MERFFDLEIDTMERLKRDLNDTGDTEGREWKAELSRSLAFRALQGYGRGEHHPLGQSQSNNSQNCG